MYEKIFIFQKFLPLKYKESEIPKEVLDFCNENEGTIIDEFVERSYKDVRTKK